MRLIVIFVFLALALRAEACGVETDCQIGDRTYRIHLPETRQDKPVGAIVFAHGWRGTAAGVMSNTSLLALADELGVALVAPQSKGEDWQLPNRPRHRDNTGEEEFSYFRRLVDEIARKFSIDPKRILMSGFSAGGMLTWNLACHEGRLFAAYAPIAGTFWAPLPKACPSPPVHLIHFHGASDMVVPLGGRVIADSKQGEVQKAIELFAESGGFGPASMEVAEGLSCEMRRNPEGKVLEFCTHPGNHAYKADYLRLAWSRLRIGASDR